MPLGERLVAAKLVSKEDVTRALERQREAGGSIGDNLVLLGVIGRSQLEAFVAQGPPKIESFADTGLDARFLRDLALKVMYAHGVKRPTDVADVLKLPVPIVRELLEGMRGRGLLESLGAGATERQLDLRYDLTPSGRDLVNEALRQSLYCGPAPVPLAQWQAQVERQRITNDRVDHAAIAKSLEGLVIAPEMIARFGPAVNAGRGMLLYGAPGDGKTSIARAIALSFKQSVWVPYAIEVEREVIKMFDPALHRERVQGSAAWDEARSPLMRAQVLADDRRWVRCARPIVVTGGELTMDMLDLKFDTVGLFSEAPLHTKMTGGVLVVDDFGRQIARPEQVLNRWVLPLESRIDFLTLHTGKKFPVAFDGLVIFSTNLTPRTIMDPAMMRRIPYNFYIAPPTSDEYVEIFRRVCADAGLPFNLEVVSAVMKRLYEEEKLPMARFHPRFIVDHVVARSNYEGRDPALDPHLVLDAAEHLYTKH
ncbi:MAG: AAA family ATPase [Gemmatimonadaceae bacterium]|nr:AAA family ATPase [Gemmatimonadaceae bacterium]